MIIYHIVSMMLYHALGESILSFLSGSLPYNSHEALSCLGRIDPSIYWIPYENFNLLDSLGEVFQYTIVSLMLSFKFYVDKLDHVRTVMWKHII